LLPRIIAVADTFDALTTNRPYQHAHDPKEALRIIHSLSGKRLDPTAVAALAAIYERGEIQVQHPTAPPPPMAAAAGAGVTVPATTTGAVEAEPSPDPASAVQTSRV
jgi:hypothetical protein